MARLYLDIETYSKRRELFIDERIIAVGVLEEKLGEEPELNVFTEWGQGSEEALVRAFYGYLGELVGFAKARSHPVEIVGYNILRYDVPLLVQAGVKHGIGTGGAVQRALARALHH